MHWRYAGGDLTRSKRLDQRADRSFIRSEGLPKSLSLACANIPSLIVLGSPPTIEVGDGIKSP
jgi:hypothetical protein